ncbi:hypothetical protein PC112_g10194 [Phytophthora cactorum]|nr:hypothetical protein PC112_g10194 [Phytophthora cactorum]
MGDFLSALEPEASSKSPRDKQEDETAKAPSTGAISRNMFVWGGDVELLATAVLPVPVAAVAHSSGPHGSGMTDLCDSSSPLANIGLLCRKADQDDES